MKRLLIALMVLLFATAALAGVNKWLEFAPSTVTITPSDSVPYKPLLKSVYVGVSGDIRVIAAEDSGTYDCTDAPIFVGFPAGANLPVRVWKICATGTTATDMVGLTYTGPK